MKMNLRVKLILFFLMVGLIPVGIVGLLSINMASDNIEEEVFAGLSMYGGLTDDQVEDFFAERLGDGRVIATTRDVYESMNIYYGQGEEVTVEGEEGEEITVEVGEDWEERRETLDMILPLFAEEYGFDQVFITDTEGLVVYDSIDEVEGAELYERDYIQGALGGDQTWSELFYSDVIHDNCIVLSTPIYSEGTSGDIVGTINILFLDQYIADYVHDGLEELGDTADAYLIDANGLLHTNTLLGELQEGAALQESINTEAVERLSGPIREGDMEFQDYGEYPDYLGNMVLGALQVSTLGDEPIGLIVEVDSAEAFAGINQMQTFAFIVIGISIAGVILFGTLIAGTIARPIQEVTGVAGQIAQGDFTVDTKVKRNDEIGQLGQAFNDMSESLRSLIGQAVEVATQVNSGSESVSSASEEMSSSLEEVSASTNEFASNAQNLSSNSQNMAEANSRILEQAEEGNQAIEEAVNQMQVISNRVTELQDVITEVDQRSNDIGKILGVITDIADQTNLLALNAAIEAARAGEQGRGFAVVAEEVRKLAEQSAEAAKEIGDLINSTQEESKKALESMNEGVKDVESGTEVVSKTGATFNEILEAVKGISKQVEETASAAEELSSGSEEMAASIEEQSSTMEEMAATAEELRGSAENLNQELSKFKYE